MRVIKDILGIALLLLLVSCGGGSMESDAKKVAELQCKTIKLYQDLESGEIDASASINIAEETQALVEEIEKKYTSQEEKEEFADAVLKALGDCL